MNKIKDLVNANNYFAPSLAIAFSIIIFGFLLRSGVSNIANKDQSITVTGSTEKIVTSDTAKWTLTLSERAYGPSATQEASKSLARSSAALQIYLKQNGVSTDNINAQNGNTTQICEISAQGYENCSLGIKGQIASANIIVETSDVDKIKILSQKISTELSQNISGNTVEYYFSGLKDIRVQMLADATKNAKERAEAVAKAGGAQVGSITSLSSGVFQVTQKNSVSVDDYGTYDTTSIEKKITATVKVNFSVR